MAWGTIRKATEEDYERLAKAAERFVARHNLEAPRWAPEMGPGEIVDLAINAASDASQTDQYNARYYRPLWRQCMRRALRHSYADGIAWGYVGYDAP